MVELATTSGPSGPPKPPRVSRHINPKPASNLYHAIRIAGHLGPSVKRRLRAEGRYPHAYRCSPAGMRPRRH